MAEMQAQLDQLPYAVQIWMNWMLVMFLLAIPFAWKRQGARWTLVAFVASIPLALAVFALSGTVHLLGIVHFVLWVPLLVYFYRHDFRAPGFDPRSAYGVWLLLVSTTMVISLLFDARDIVLVAMGTK